MNPADPVTRTFCISGRGPFLFSVFLFVGPDLFGRQAPPEGEPVPPQVAGYPLGDLEVRHPRLAVKPDRGDLRHRQPQPLRFRGELDAELEPVSRVDADLADEVRGVRLE